MASEPSFPLLFLGSVFTNPLDILMYHAIVKRIARNAFEDLSDRKVEPLTERAAPDLHHTFAGDHALGGTRHSREAFSAWMQRLYRLFPELTFTIRDMMANGPPWNTRLAIAWNDRGVAADGVDYENEGVHLLRLEWGRLTELHAKLDTQHLERTLDRMADAGIEEAAADPIGDADPSAEIAAAPVEAS